MKTILEQEEVAEIVAMFGAINEELANLRRTVNAIHNELSIVRKENREAQNEGADRALREAATGERAHEVAEVLDDTSMSMVASSSDEDSGEDDLSGGDPPTPTENDEGGE